MIGYLEIHMEEKFMAKFIGDVVNCIINTLIAIGNWILFGNAWIYILIATAVIVIITIVMAIKYNR